MRQVDHVRVELSVSKKWWFTPAFWSAAGLVGLGLISSERAASWLADFAFFVEAR